jgi:hypothetical protein
VRRPVYLQDSGVDTDQGTWFGLDNLPPEQRRAALGASGYRGTAPASAGTRRTSDIMIPQTQPTPNRTITIPSVEDFSAALQGTTTAGMFGNPVVAGRFANARVPEGWQERWDQTIDEARNTAEFYDQQRANAAVGGGGGPSRQDLIDAAFANLSSPDVYAGEADMQALADYYGGARGRLDDVYGGAVGRIGATTAETLAALAEMDPQAAFVYDVGAPNIPGVNVDYLRALGASADPVSAEADFARELLGYQLAASQQASAGMQASLDRERQARLAASRLMQQEGLRLTEQARAQALADLAARQAQEEAIIRERVRAAQQAEADRQQELEMLRCCGWSWHWGESDAAPQRRRTDGFVCQHVVS